MEICYVRYAGKPWERGRFHQERALRLYLSEPLRLYMKAEPMTPITISVPHIRGGQFIAHFSKINDSVFHYQDEYKNEVDIMMCTPEKAAYINRIMDF